MTAALRPLAVSLGDPAGIGPELIAEAWARRDAVGLPVFAVVGGAGVLRAAAESRGIEVPLTAIDRLDEAADAFADALPVLSSEDAPARFGEPNSEGAALALHSLENATRLVREGEASALVTMPIAKAHLAAVGFAFPGQTEFLAHRCGLPEESAVMMLASPGLRTVPLTIHCALADVPGLISHDMIVAKARIVAAALRRDFGLDSPRLALAGLNPHAGEQGRMGREEIEAIAPAVATLRAEGVDASGPHPGDALFTHRARATYDVALAMYHDQALIPLKALDVDAGVNVTLGLPIVRTSPDHGTAFDIAGRNLADPGATIAAIRMAGECAARRAHG